MICGCEPARGHKHRESGRDSQHTVNTGIPVDVPPLDVMDSKHIINIELRSSIKANSTLKRLALLARQVNRWPPTDRFAIPRQASQWESAVQGVSSRNSMVRGSTQELINVNGAIGFTGQLCSVSIACPQDYVHLRGSILALFIPADWLGKKGAQHRQGAPPTPGFQEQFFQFNTADNSAEKDWLRSTREPIRFSANTRPLAQANKDLGFARGPPRIDSFMNSNISTSI